MDRFMFRVIMVPESDCWYWSLHLDKDGYGTFAVDGKTRHAHIVGYELFIGPIPGGMQLDHKCRNRGCVKFRHLEPVTNVENQLRSPATMSGKTECKYGHGTEHFIEKYGRRRVCTVCQRDQWRRKHKLDKARKGRGSRLNARTHCNHGHEFTPENTWMKLKSETGKRFRSCRTCMALRAAARKAKNAR
jgi:hypothetical protein